MEQYQSLADDFYITMNLSTEMDLSSSRETILHFAEQIQKKYPEMRNFYAREKGDFVLEEDKDDGRYRWCSIEPRRISSGQVNPDSVEGALAQHRYALDLAPYMLSLSPLDCEALDLMIGFDFTYRGNHNQLVAEALGVCPGYERLASLPGTAFVNYEPNLTLSFDEECRVQCRVSVETRTTPYQIRTGEYQEDQISVYITSRRYGSLASDTSYVSVLGDLTRICLDVLDSYVVDSVLEPLARTIALD